MSKAATIDALMESAIHCFSQYGYEGVSLRNIATEAGVPLSTIPCCPRIRTTQSQVRFEDPSPAQLASLSEQQLANRLTKLVPRAGKAWATQIVQALSEQTVVVLVPKRPPSCCRALRSSW